MATIGAVWNSGETLTYGVNEADGTERTAAGTSMTEEGTTGHYIATNTDIEAGDIVIIKSGTQIILGGEYEPEISATDIETKIDTVDTNLDSVLVAQQQVRSSVDGTVEDDTRAKILI